jgi:hypothetical protein
MFADIVQKAAQLVNGKMLSIARPPQSIQMGNAEGIPAFP